jgi:hypothetical protein
LEAVFHGGLRIGPPEIPAIVAQVCAGRIPPPRKGRPHTEDPVLWLDGLLHEVRDTPLHEPVRRALDLTLRTGSSSQIEVVAALARRHDLFEPAALMAALERPSAWQRPRTAPDLAAGVSRALLADRHPWDEQLRAWALDRRLDGALLPALLQLDLDFAVAELPAILSRDCTSGARRLAAALRALPEARREEVLSRLAGRRAGLTDDAWSALIAAVPELAPPEPPEPERPPGPPPWRGEDGRWYSVPEGTRLPPGALVLRRGLWVWRVDPTSARPWAISAAAALADRALHTEAVWRQVAGEALRGTELAELLGGPTAEVLTDPAARQRAAARAAELRRRLAEVWEGPEAKALAEAVGRAVREG